MRAWGQSFPSVYSDTPHLNDYLSMFYDERATTALARRAAPTSEWSLNVPVPRQTGYLEGLRGTSLGLVFNSTGSVDPAVREIQTELARLGFLFSEPGPEGVDGRWGPRTRLALRHAAAYVGWTGDFVIELRATASDVPDELMQRLRAARPAPAGTPGTVSADAPATTPSGGMGTGTMLLLAALVVGVGYYLGTRD